MAPDEYGFDPDKTITIPDNEFWDGTDAAHPAWWRGEEYGVQSTIRLLTDWLDKPIEELENGFVHYEHIQVIKDRILLLRKTMSINIGRLTDIRYDIGVDYELSHDNCNDDDYHRDCLIENIKVKINNYHAYYLLDRVETKNELEKILALLFFKYVIDPQDCKVNVCWGYYEQEIDSVYIGETNNDKIGRFNDLISENKINELVHCMMTAHYGYVLPELHKFNDWQFIKLPIGDIYAPSAGLKQVHKNNWYADLKIFPSWFPGCIAIPHKDKYKIIDGFHRWTAYTQKGRKNVGLIIPK